MENFIVSARKYRPSSFDMVVGQDTITNTLKSAIASNHLAHAYLFCGPRGVGKTTCARIFAKTINCMNLTEGVEACNQCESCVAFNSSRSYNIHELDAASNNKVDDIRTLTDQVRIPPQVGKYSVYIIDEVHMLSSAAFNAFLKTLEEPPAHAIFILATTEKHKIIPTILSRCQIFDFNRIKIEDMIVQMKRVAENENISAEEEALHIISQKADGAMRDALSIFDQMVSLCGTTITYKDVIDNLNILDYEYYFQIVDAILHNNLSKILIVFDEILSKGFDARNFLVGLNHHFRDILVAKDPATHKLIENTPTIRQRYALQAEQCSISFLYKALDVCNSFDTTYSTTKDTRLHIELALIKLCSLIYSETETANSNKTVSSGNQNRSDVKVEHSRTFSSLNNISTEPKPQYERASSSLRTVSIKSGLSANSVQSGKKADPQQAQSPQSNTNSNVSVVAEPTTFKKFDANALKKIWKELENSFISEGPRVQAIFHETTPTLSNDNTITISFNNSDRLNSFDSRYKPQMRTLIQQQYGRSDIEIVMDVAAENQEALYTNEQRLRYLQQKNSTITDFIKTFDLI